MAGGRAQLLCMHTRRTFGYALRASCLIFGSVIGVSCVQVEGCWRLGSLLTAALAMPPACSAGDRFFRHAQQRLSTLLFGSQRCFPHVGGHARLVCTGSRAPGGHAHAPTLTGHAFEFCTARRSTTCALAQHSTAAASAWPLAAHSRHDSDARMLPQGAVW